jgi:dipeptidyl aminopeptidase/acylaminoacyl peptidase
MRLLLLLVSALVLVGQTRRPITIADQHRILNVGDPQCSPDGEWIAYTLSTVDTQNERRDTDVWMVSRDGTRNLRMTSSTESENSPRFSPDGKYISFMSSRPGKTPGAQVWVLNRAGGEAEQLTDVKGRISGYDWFPDSKKLVLVMSEPNERDRPQGAPGSTPAATPAPTGGGRGGRGGDAQNNRPIVIDRYAFKRDGTGYISEPRGGKIYLFDIATKKLEALTTDKYEENSPEVSPDGKWIAFTAKRIADPDRTNNTHVWVAEAKAGSVPRQISNWTGSNGGGGRGGGLAWSPDSTRLAYTQGAEMKYSAYSMSRLVMAQVNGGSPRVLTANFDRGVSAPRFTEDGSAIEFMVTDDRYVYPARISVNGGQVERLRRGPEMLSGITKVGACHAALVSTDTRAGDVYGINGTQLKQLTHHNDWMSELDLQVAQDIEFKSPDGTEPHGLLVKPLGYVEGRRYPTLLRIHGGPNSQDQHNFHFEWQLFAANGYAVIAVNYRGSAGRGEAFSRSIAGDWGPREVMDLLAGVDHVVKMGVADPDRLGIGGWSYGGILTDQAIARDTRFKAAISGAGVANVIGFYGTDQYILQYDHEVGPPWKNLDPWLRISYPFLHADRIKTPTLFMGGDRDFNVPIQGGEHMYQALRSLGIDTQLVIYPGETHGITRLSFQKDRLERYLKWYDKCLKTPAATGAAP